MRKSLIPLMLAGVAFPLSAFAQDAQQTPDTSTPPAATDSASPDSTMAPSGGAMSPDTGASTGDAGSTGDTSTSMDTPSADTSSSSSDMAGAGAGSSETFVTVPPNGAWRVTDLDGKDVYGADGESIGAISDVLVSEDGRVMAVLVGVGGFLGIGEKDVAVSMTALEFGPGKTEGLKTEEQASSEMAAATPATGTAGGATGASPDPAAGGAGGAAMPAETQEPVVGEDNLPDRIVLNVTRDQLEQAPAYNEPESGEASGDAMSTGAGTGMAPASGGGAMSGSAPASGDQPAAQ